MDVGESFASSSKTRCGSADGVGGYGEITDKVWTVAPGLTTVDFLGGEIPGRLFEGSHVGLHGEKQERYEASRRR